MSAEKRLRPADATTTSQQRPAMLDAESHAVHVHLEGALEQLRCEFVKGDTERLNASVVDEDMQLRIARAKVSDQLPDGGL